MAGHQNNTVEKENNLKSASFVKIVKAYKELIAIMVFFIGGAMWIFGYFATKQQLAQLQCITIQNINFMQGRIDTATFSDLLISTLEQIALLKEKPSLSPEEVAKLQDLELSVERISARLAQAETSASTALERLRSGTCQEN